jgi:hypothetical protein
MILLYHPLRGRPSGGSWHPPDAASPLMACRQPSGLVVARTAALRASICRDLFVRSMKLSFKRPLTDKCHAPIDLGHVLNWAVLPFVTRGRRVSPVEPHNNHSNKDRIQVWSVPA